jgi:predicted DCC family thiol-disulfide oxidoreductase YuxK
MALRQEYLPQRRATDRGLQDRLAVSRGAKRVFGQVSMTKQGIFIFDGACGVCTASVQWVQRRDVAGRLACLPYQTADLDSISPGLTEEMANRAAYFVRGDGHRFRGARAVFEALRRLPGVWKLVGTVGALAPVSLLCEPVYRLFAANRTRISIWLGLTACAVPVASRPDRRIEQPLAPGPDDSRFRKLEES